jgi:glutathione synthase/RimK-type ligase-like ATP-grasp enzyme
MRVALLADRHPPEGRLALLLEATRLLREWGAEADLLSPRTAAGPGRHDLHLVACEGEEALEVARRLSEAGALLVDAYPAVRAVWDAEGTLRRLARAGVPVLPGGPGARATHTLDGIDGQVFGVVHAARAAWRDAPVALSPELRGIALRCAEVLDLALYAVDLRVRRHDLGVVAVRAFPTLSGVPDAALRLADFVYAAAERAACGLAAVATRR